MGLCTKKFFYCLIFVQIWFFLAWIFWVFVLSDPLRPILFGLSVPLRGRLQGRAVVGTLFLVPLL